MLRLTIAMYVQSSMYIDQSVFKNKWATFRASGASSTSSDSPECDLRIRLLMPRSRPRHQLLLQSTIILHLIGCSGRNRDFTSHCVLDVSPLRSRESSDRCDNERAEESTFDSFVDLSIDRRRDNRSYHVSRTLGNREQCLAFIDLSFD